LFLQSFKPFSNPTLRFKKTTSKINKKKKKGKKWENRGLMLMNG
jgi:hypothetical protein